MTLRRLILGSLLVLGLSPSTLWAVQLTGVRCALQPDGAYRMVLDLDGPASYDHRSTADGTEYTVRLPGVSWAADGSPFGCDSALIVSATALESGSDAARLQIHTRERMAGRVFQLRPFSARGHRIVLDLSPLAVVAAPPEAQQAASSQAVVAVAPADPPPAAARQGGTVQRTSAPAPHAQPPGWKMRGYIAAEGRGFLQSAQFSGQRGSGISLVAEPEFFRMWQEDSISFKAYLRWDQHDSRRSYGDVRELLWLHAGDGWELAAGVGKVFWGVTEAYHLVDIINQTDLVANPDAEQKLGQPMLKLAAEREWGTLTLFALPGFRERTFPGSAGRFRPALLVDTDAAVYQDGRGQWDWDWALRWSHYHDDLDIGVAHFHGTGREPTLVPGLSGGGQPVLIPRYELIDQTSVDAQLTRGDWLWKLEALRRSGQGSTFWAMTGGFEYTLVGIADSAADLGLLAELMYDSRGDSATTPFNRDVFLGLRWTANDVQSTELLAGLITDWDNGAKAFNLEASRRFGQRWKLQVQARAWFDVPADDPLAAYQRDDYIETTLFRYF